MRLRDILLEPIPIAKPIAYYPDLAPHIGIKATILLCQLAYWTGKGNGRLGPQWIYKSREELQAETGLSDQELRAARNRLKRLRIIEEYYDRPAHRLYFRVDQYRLIFLWKQWHGHLLK